MKKLTILAVLAMGTTLAACGPTHPHHGPADTHAHKDAMVNYYFYRMDTNGDGWVSRAEHESFASGMFTRVDVNRDGYVTYRELTDYQRGEWADWRDNYASRSEGYYEGDKYYPYGKGAPTKTPNEPYAANRGKTDRSYKNYEIRDHHEDGHYHSDGTYHRY